MPGRTSVSEVHSSVQIFVSSQGPDPDPPPKTPPPKTRIRIPDLSAALTIKVCPRSLCFCPFRQPVFVLCIHGQIGTPRARLAGPKYIPVPGTDIHGPKPYKFIGFGDIHGPKPCKFTGFGDIHKGRENFLIIRSEAKRSKRKIPESRPARAESGGWRRTRPARGAVSVEVGLLQRLIGETEGGTPGCRGRAGGASHVFGISRLAW